MKYLVISFQHLLLPLAHRLQLEGHDAEVLVWKSRFERAWSGKLEKKLRSARKKSGRSELTSENLDPVFEDAVAGGTAILTDVHLTSPRVTEAPWYYGTRKVTVVPRSMVRLGGWFDGAQFQAPHVVIVDQGVWPGGLGSDHPGGLTLVRLGEEHLQLYHEITHDIADELKSVSFRGLVQMGLNSAPDGSFQLHGVVAGWPFLHTHAFLSELDGFGDVLVNEHVPVIGTKFTTVVPVSVPSWPNTTAPAKRDLVIEGLTPQQQGRVFWHDVQVDAKEQRLTSAGLDGLIGVVRGAADTSVLARGRAMEIAHSLRVPEKQFRPDAGAMVPEVLAGLEQSMDWVL